MSGVVDLVQHGNRKRNARLCSFVLSCCRLMSSMLLLLLFFFFFLPYSVQYARPNLTYRASEGGWVLAAPTALGTATSA